MRCWVVILFFGLLSALRADEENAPYEVVRQDDAFEVRAYPALVLVETAASGENDNGSFGRLFRYISGANAEGQKIPMTAPVFRDPRGADGRMSFVMPAAMPLAETPKAKDETLTIREQPAGRYAVYRFSGAASTAAEKQALEKLTAWMSKEALTAVGPAVFAYYDPPWTLPFLRRNEVMVPLGPTAGTGGGR